MRVLALSVENIGPFDQAHLEFVGDPEEAAPVTLITGENGSGKSILLDAIRGMFGANFCQLERSIWREAAPFRIELEARYDGHAHKITSNSPVDRTNFLLSDWTLNHRLDLILQGGSVDHFVVDFWRTTQATDPYEITGFTNQDHRVYLQGSLQGTHKNRAVTELICYFDYLRDSRDPAERKAGEMLSEVIAKIIAASLLDGEFSHVARSTFTPIVRQSGQTVPLANVSSGNAYLIQRMISVLGKMYAVHVLRGGDPAELCNTPGLLLIDEAENHLHPRWQKRFIKNILSVFPNLQIIATTHSPFILASAPGARVYVCKFNGKSCVVTEETDSYANKPVDEILVSSAFDETQPFSEEISVLIQARKAAAERGDVVERRRIEKLLQHKNPDYFSYFEVEDRLRAVSGGAR